MHRRARSTRLIAASIALVVLSVLTACGTPPSATVSVLSGAATIDGTPVSSGQRVSAGDVVEVTGSEALVEIQWTDGSFTRLASGTQFEVDGSEARGRLATGTAWNTVASAGGYALETPRGTVQADPGSTFAVRCGTECEGIVVAGAVRASDLDAVAPARFIVGSSVVEPAGWDVAFADAFALTNAQRDEAAGYPAAADAWAERSPTLASVRGEFSGPSVAGTQTCTGWPDECARVQANLFPAGTSTFTLAESCATTLPCAVVMRTETTLVGGGTNVRETALAFDGTAYTASIVFGEGSYCTLADGSEQGLWRNSGTVRFEPTAAEVREGRLMTTVLGVETRSDVTRVQATTDPSCAEFEYEWVNEKRATLTLVAGSESSTAVYSIAADPLRPVSGAAKPSVLSELREPVDAIPSLGQAGILAAGVLVLVLVLGYPAFLLSRVVSDRYDAIAGDRGARMRARLERRPAGRFLAVVLGMVMASFITAALDPSFGAEFASVLSDPGTFGVALAAFGGNLASWRLVLTAFVAFVLFLGIGSLVVRLAARRIAPGERMPLVFRWGSLGILLAGVVVSRVFEINPGIIFGLVAGLVIADTIPAAAKGRLAFVSAAFALVVGVGSWIGYGVVSPLAAASPTELPLVIGAELLSALTIEAIATMPLAFLPILGFDGFVLRGWRLVVWALTYALGLALFVLLLFTVPGAWAELDPQQAVVWGIGFGAFTVVAVAVFAIHEALKRRTEKRTATPEPEVVAPPE